jgi:predicted Rossmann fold nucleotide-binding protein DprA/Smf involved in DNA uptake
MVSASKKRRTSNKELAKGEVMLLGVLAHADEPVEIDVLQQRCGLEFTEFAHWVSELQKKAIIELQGDPGQETVRLLRMPSE